MTKVAIKQKSAKSAPKDSRLTKLIKSSYNAQQQVHYLYLEAEIDSLLLQQQTLKAKRKAQM
jgi:hypothetical protein